MSTLEQSTSTAVAALARVNLLPPEIAEDRRFTRLRLVLAGAIVVTLAGSGGLYVLAERSSRDAAAQLRAEQDRSSGITRESAQYAAVPQMEAQTQAVEKSLQTAMGQEVRWSYFLNDLTSVIPADAWLTGLTMTQPLTTTAPAQAAALDPTAPVAGFSTPGIASLTYDGVGRTYPAVAAWLAAQEAITTSDSPYLSETTTTKIGGVDVVKFTTTATINEGAYSQRYDTPQGPRP